MVYPRSKARCHGQGQGYSWDLTGLTELTSDSIWSFQNVYTCRPRAPESSLDSWNHLKVDTFDTWEFRQIGDLSSSSQLMLAEAKQAPRYLFAWPYIVHRWAVMAFTDSVCRVNHLLTWIYPQNLIRVPIYGAFVSGSTFNHEHSLVSIVQLDGSRSVRHKHTLGIPFSGDETIPNRSALPPFSVHMHDGRTWETKVASLVRCRAATLLRHVSGWTL